MKIAFSVKNFIRNKELPICSKCLHFIEHTNNYPYDPIPSNERHGKCKKFGEMNIITGIIEYDLANNLIKLIIINRFKDFTISYII